MEDDDFPFDIEIVNWLLANPSEEDRLSDAPTPVHPSDSQAEF
jgi:hypothetical protein